MAINHTYSIINKYIEGDCLVTDISIQFSGDVTELVETSVYHYQPETVADVEDNIEKRIVTEQGRILARQKIQEIINEL